MATRRLQKMPKVMPHDPRRMAYGGFRTLASVQGRRLGRAIFPGYKVA